MSHPNHGGARPDGRHHFRPPQPPQGAVPAPRQPVAPPYPRQMPPPPPPAPPAPSQRPPEPPQAPVPHYVEVAPRNGLGLTALILGLVALPFILTGLTAWISVILGLIAIPLALAGLGRVRRRLATNRGVAITGLVLGPLAIVLGIASTVATLNALGEVFDGPTATVVGQDGARQQTADNVTTSTGPVPLGTTMNVDGVNVTVTEISSRVDVGKRLTCAEVSYVNESDGVSSRAPSDWSARNPDGASVGSWIYTERDALEYGDLASGGRDTGVVCFDVPRDEVAVIEYKANMFNDGPDAEWVVE